MGTWVYDTPEHKHENPSVIHENKPVGSIFQCSCGEFFRLETSKAGYDQRERDSWWNVTWRLLIKGERIKLNDGTTVVVGDTWPFKKVTMRGAYEGDTVLGGYRDR